MTRSLREGWREKPHRERELSTCVYLVFRVGFMQILKRGMCSGFRGYLECDTSLTIEYFRFEVDLWGNIILQSKVFDNVLSSPFMSLSMCFLFAQF